MASDAGGSKKPRSLLNIPARQSQKSQHSSRASQLENVTVTIDN